MDIINPKLDDIPEISSIYAQSWKKAYKGLINQNYLDSLKYDFWVPLFEKSLKDGGPLKLIAATEKGRIIGALSYQKSQDKEFTGYLEIVSLYIHPEFFNKGYGGTLINSIKSMAEKEKNKGLFLWVMTENKNARAFYEKSGFMPLNDFISFKISGNDITNIRYIYNIN